MNIENLTLHDIMAEDFYVAIEENPKFGYDLQLVNDDTGDESMNLGVHPCAMEGLAEFCRMYLSQYERVCES